jgi:hypothetical protein
MMQQRRGNRQAVQRRGGAVELRDELVFGYQRG